MKKRISKIISATLALVFSFYVIIPPAYAGLPCWNDGSITYAVGGVDPGTGVPSPDSRKAVEHNGDPVNLSTGAFAFQHQDAFIPSRGLSVEIIRFYNNLDKSEGPFGIGWSHNYNTYLMEISEANQSYILKRNPDGTRDKFLKKADGAYEAVSPGCYDTLTKYAILPYQLLLIAPQGLNSTYHLRTKNGLDYLFDFSGRLRVIAERNQNKITLAYDTSGRLTTIYDTLNHQIRLNYNANNKIAAITDFSGRTYNYEYNASCDLTAVTTPKTGEHPYGLTTNYTYDTQHNLVSITDPRANTYLVNYYDSNNRVVKQTFGQATYYFTYADNLTTFVDRKGYQTCYYLNSDGTTAKKVQYSAGLRANEPSAYTTLYEYNQHREITKITYPKGNSVCYEYDALGNVSKIIRKPVSGSTTQPDIITSFTYEPNYNFIKTITDSKGNVTIYDYDIKGNLTKITYPQVGSAIIQARFTYNQYGQAETVTNPNAVVTKYEYDSNTGYLVKITNDYGDTAHLNTATQFSYDSAGNVLSITDALGNTTNFEYNSLNQLLKTTSPKPFNYQTRYTYDENANLIKLERQQDVSGSTWQVTEYQYDILDQLIETRQQLTDTEILLTRYQYDANGNGTEITDAQGNSTTYNYDERNLLFQVTDALGNVTEYTYDANGNLKEIKDAQANITAYAYDDFDRLIKTTYPDSSTEKYSYDVASNLKAKTNPKGQTIYYAYDSLNRLTEKGLSPQGAVPDSVVSYAYDISSRLSQVTDTGGSISYAYDNLNRITRVTYPADKSVSYAYDVNSNRTKLTYPDASYITYVYDELNRLTAIQDQAGANIASYVYDVLSRRTQQNLANNIQTTYEYDDINRLTKLKGLSPTGTVPEFSYTYDKAGNRLSMTTAQGTHSYTYDKIYQLTGHQDATSQSHQFNYDAVGNRISTANANATNYTSNNLNQYTKVGAVDYTYDANGNLASDGTNTYTYDYENRLIEGTVPEQGLSLTYKYDPFGRRIKKGLSPFTLSAVEGQGTVPDMVYLYDGDQLIAEYDGSGNLITKYIYGPGIDEPVKGLSLSGIITMTALAQSFTSPTLLAQ